VEEIMTIPGYEDAERGEKLISEAKTLIEKYQKEGLPIPVAPSQAKEAKETRASGSAKEQADQRLKQELQKLDAQAEAADVKE
jgi:N utilization substance protein A